MTPTAVPAYVSPEPECPKIELAVSLILIAKHVFILLFLIPNFAGMLREMGSGVLPSLTQYLFLLARFAIPLGVLLVALAIVLYRTHQAAALRMMCWGLFGFIGVEVLALFMPLIGTMEKLGK